ncbi:hypothetical protein C9F11_18790 [Streptomyces sp. YIM 121038]|uniref:DUF397 domain-containing protein n=1 Tax=Streptomyces sp. YIM 121038 TaxID=2136401 RepID=UPI0011100527|nr:DUF397 domain-containing protein [Streptomyces sp. YIM 121038]QCX77410.1 hypothetical protein C9F11_18790 [Streptomyces sp. YIM 121038]
MRSNPDYDLSTAVWHKSSYSGGGGNECLEVARWRKSTYSAGDGGNCLEVADGPPDVIPVRDSKDPLGPHLLFHPPAWSAFISSLGA